MSRSQWFETVWYWPIGRHLICVFFTEPENELASLLLVTSIDVRHVHLNGTPINGASRHATVETQVGRQRQANPA